MTISTKTEEKSIYWVFILPALLLYGAVMIFPSAFSILSSFTNYDGGSLFEKGAVRFSGLKNYITVFKDKIFYLSLKNNFYIVLISV